MLPLSRLLVFLFPLKYVIMSHNPAICKKPGLPLFSSLSATYLSTALPSEDLAISKNILHRMLGKIMNLRENSKWLVTVRKLWHEIARISFFKSQMPEKSFKLRAKQNIRYLTLRFQFKKSLFFCQIVNLRYILKNSNYNQFSSPMFEKFLGYYLLRVKSSVTR